MTDEEFAAERKAQKADQKIIATKCGAVADLDGLHLGPCGKERGHTDDHQKQGSDLVWFNREYRAAKLAEFHLKHVRDDQPPAKCPDCGRLETPLVEAPNRIPSQPLWEFQNLDRIGNLQRCLQQAWNVTGQYPRRMAVNPQIYAIMAGDLGGAKEFTFCQLPVTSNSAIPREFVSFYDGDGGAVLVSMLTEKAVIAR